MTPADSTRISSANRVYWVTEVNKDWNAQARVEAYEVMSQSEHMLGQTKALEPAELYVFINFKAETSHS